ncbi:ShlB/FhaC/HecB family hemolysin secretion/activation protein [Dapis sp. BLCC M229]|uniref:two-partner secretion domain-containing protein n=1 Tax=Dapis sp. BLCC M229 TaxID=3400188 RepID=UPI003CF861EE
MKHFYNFQIYTILILTYLILGYCRLSVSPAIAQLQPDITLGKDNSVITPNVNIKGIESDRIDGGAQRGANLFHSFQEFNIQRGRGVYFSNPDGVVNILTRITGNNISNILGTLGVLGNANLFFINPNGIIFGADAQLDIGGSFYGSTADSILFKNGYEFSTSDPQAPPLLKVNLPIGLRLPENPGSIQVEGRAHNLSFDPDTFSNIRENRNVGLQVPTGKTLALVGGDISLRGGNLTSESGHIQLGSIQSGVVGLTSTSSSLHYGEVSTFGNIQLSQASSVDVSGAGAGETQIQGRAIEVQDGSIILGNTLGSEDGGTSTIRASELIKIEGTTPDGQILSSIVAEVAPGATGKGGNLIVETKSLELRERGQIGVNTLGQGKGGNLTISATNIELIGVSTDSFGRDTSINAIVEFGVVGNAGDIRIDTESLRLWDGAQIGVGTFGQGNAGNLTISATNVELIGTSADGMVGSSLFTTVVTPEEIIEELTEPEVRENGGSLSLETENLIVRDGALISTATFGQGNAGNINISATNVELTGTSSNGQFVSTFSSVAASEAIGNGGSLRLETENLIVQDGAQIATSTFGQGNGGDLTISAKKIEMIGTTADGQVPSGLFASVQKTGEGNGGSINIKTENLRVEDGAKIGVDVFGQGNGGELTISATNIDLMGIAADGQRVSEMTAAVQEEAIGNGRNITLNTTNLQIQNGARITASTSGQGNAGDITISAKNLQLTGTSANGTPSRLTAEADSTATGAGGTLTINTETLNLRNQAEITVSSATKQRAGNLVINSNNILISNQASLNAETTAEQGNITINNNKDLILRNKSNITTNATGEATGGNIEINTENLVAQENSDISANAQQAFGGTINISAAGIFGTEFRPQQTNQSDITATSELGASFSGEVNINTPEVDPSDGLVEFDDTIPDISNLIDQNPCRQGQSSQFTITGLGGLPPNPTDPLTPNTLWQDPQTTTTPGQTTTSSDPEFIEAQGWISTPQGIQLITNPHTATPARPWLIPPECEQLDTQQPPPYLLASSNGTIPTRGSRLKLWEKPNPPTPFPTREGGEDFAPLGARQRSAQRSQLTQIYPHFPARRPTTSTSQPLKVTIQQFNFTGNTKFSNQELQQQLTPYLNQPITFAQLIAARTAITQYYTQNNYITSGAFIPTQTISDNGTITLQVVEGKVSEINVNIQGRLNNNYIKSRLKKATTAPLNQEKLFSALQLLQLDPNIKTISAELSAGVSPDISILDVEVVTANPWQIATISNNGRAPSVGTFRRGVEVGYGNITGMGDSLNTLYTNTDGSDTVEISYSLPVNSSNGRIELFYRRRDNEVIESPFERLDIESNSNTYELSFRQPIVQTPYQNLNLGLSATRRDSQTSILGTNFPLSEGADDNGETKLSIVQFFQDYQLRGDNQVLAFNSQFNVGLGILDATVNSNEPDSRFFYWRGQGQWVRELAENTLLVVGADVQLSPSELVPLERFGLGGYRSVRAYRQDTRLTDNGVLGTLELRLPVPWISGEKRLFQVVPFIDGGVAWNSDGEEVEGRNGLAAVGVGLQVSLWQRVQMRLDYGIPLVDVDSRDKTAQEEGFYFSVSASPFDF